MLIGIEGELGGGKTLLMVKYLLDEYRINHREIQTNLKLNNIPYKEIDILELLENDTELNNVVLGIDELTVFVDCRTSMSKSNRFFSYLVLQSRKRNVDVYFTTQNLSMIDKRVIDHTPLIVLCEKIYDSENKLVNDYRYYTIFDLRNIRKPFINRYLMDITKFYKEYDTDQIITPLFKNEKKKL